MNSSNTNASGAKGITPPFYSFVFAAINSILKGSQINIKVIHSGQSLNKFFPYKKYVFLSLLISLLSGYFIWGAASVPFHPDESTYLFMSSDFELWLSQPLSLVFNPENAQDERQRYRLIDAPLTRYYLGFVHYLFGLEALRTDWNWSADWNENLAAGAVPDPGLLRTSRIGISLLFPFCLFLIFLLGREIQGDLTGVLAVLFLGLNTLMFVHNRRAMTEAWLTLGILLTLWGTLKSEQGPWIAGLGLGIAFAAKHTAILLLPVVSLVIIWPAWQNRIRITCTFRNLLQFGAIFLIVTILVNPVFWREPWKAGQAAWQERTQLVAQQAADMPLDSTINGWQSIPLRLGATLTNLYLAPPAFYELGNYTTETAQSEAAYLKIPGHSMLRNPIGASVFLFLTLFGLMTSLREYKWLSCRQKKAQSILWLAGLLILLGILFLVPMPWQRYVMPLVPFSCLWMAYALAHLLSKIKRSLFQN